MPSGASDLECQSLRHYLEHPVGDTKIDFSLGGDSKSLKTIEVFVVQKIPSEKLNPSGKRTL
jgi:hypothetical protein